MLKQITFLFMVFIFTTTISNAQWTYSGPFPNNTFAGQNHAMTIDPDGKIWVGQYKNIIYEPLPGKPLKAAVYLTYIFNPDGSQASFSPLFQVMGDTMYSVSQRGMRTNIDGNILLATGGNISIGIAPSLYLIDYKTGIGLKKFSMAAAPTAPAVSSNGTIFIAPVSPGAFPMVMLNQNLQPISSAIQTTIGFSRSFEVSKDGNTIYWAGYTNGKIYIYNRANDQTAFSLTDSILTGIRAESFTWHPKTGYLWISAGSQNDQPFNGFSKGTWYAYDVANKKIVDSLKWNYIDVNNPAERPRALAFSYDGKIAYAGSFASGTAPLVEKFIYNGDPGWSIILSVKDKSNTGSDLTFGVNSNATNGLDISLGETALPPNPPAGVFDARFELPGGTEFSVKDFRKDGQDKITWVLNFQPGASGYPFTFSWDNSKIPLGSFILKDQLTGTIVNADMKAVSSCTVTNTGIKSLVIEYNKTSCVNVNLINGWQLISLPVTPIDSRISTNFPNTTSQAYIFDNGYKTIDSIKSYNGFWLRYPNNTLLSICGIPSGNSINIKAGWNLLGVNKEILASQLQTTPANIINSNIYGFQNEYAIVTTLRAGQGYWLRSSQDGVLNLPTVINKSVINYNAFQLQKNWNNLIVKDNSGKNALLYHTNQSVLVNNFSLPPIPPAGIFDARWDNQSMVEQLSASPKDLVIHSAQYPVSIIVEGTDLRIKDKFEGKFINSVVKKGEVLTISNPAVSMLEISTVDLPISFELMQNYPNPFNPSTTIAYSIPEAGRVILKVYDILGREVATLVDELMLPGFYNSQFKIQNSQLSSSVYFYELRAGNFRGVKKLILMK